MCRNIGLKQVQKSKICIFKKIVYIYELLAN